MSKRAVESCRNGSLIQFINCRILYRGAIVLDDLWVRDGKICNPEQIFFDEKVQADLKIDCKNLIISPGFIDVQINGGFGHDFSSNVEKLDGALKYVAKGILAHGVTSFCPTIVTSPSEVYKKALPKISAKQGGSHGAEIIGAHIEGPFINAEKKGAHNPEYITVPTKDAVRGVTEIYGSLDNAAMVTIAPEIDGALEAIPHFVRNNVIVSIGHSNANLLEGEEAVRRGATFITHLFNAMAPFHHRDPGLIGVLTSNVIPKYAFYGIIADGIHTHPTALRIAYRAHPKGLVLVTDAIAAMGLPPGEHLLGTMKVNIEKNRATLVGTNTLAGSIVTMKECLRHFRKAAGCSTVEALEAATLHPAQLLGIENKKGTLEFYSDADFVIIDDEFNIHATFISGQPVYIYENGYMNHVADICI
ncbi:N-acetylglucosamine-6-phosphate deacetylase-like [Rhopilema esculentum]|uniref:N-acetylglucosamine-6-phosphate deacetylase-like n=1 Tax=Rhopilema esculentum TaxID=499914 RepID=UPI0031D815F5